jgi:hypothetical protein
MNTPDQPIQNICNQALPITRNKQDDIMNLEYLASPLERKKTRFMCSTVAPTFDKFSNMEETIVNLGASKCTVDPELIVRVGVSSWKVIGETGIHHPMFISEVMATSRKSLKETLKVLQHANVIDFFGVKPEIDFFQLYGKKPIYTAMIEMPIMPFEYNQTIVDVIEKLKLGPCKDFVTYTDGWTDIFY